MAQKTAHTIALMREANYTDTEIEEELGVSLQSQQDLYCEIGKHKWKRDKKAGKKPRNCLDHRPTAPVKSTVRVLHCELGNHDWEAPRKKGKGPENCPDHRLVPTIDLDKMQDGRRIKNRAEREKRIQERITGKQCQCGIEPSMDDAELRALYPGCHDPQHICPVLDAVMRAVYTYV